MNQAPHKTPALEKRARTWFDVSDEGTTVEISSREYGDVGRDRAGQKDKDEAKRLLKLLRKAYPASKWVTDAEVIDEWVHVNLRKLPRTKAEKDKVKAEKAAQARREEAHKITAHHEEEYQEMRAGEPRDDLRDAFSWRVNQFSNPPVENVCVNYGERILYWNHCKPGFKFATADEARAAGEALCLKLGGEWRCRVGELIPHTTYNYNPPNNVIERKGEIEFTRIK